MTSSTRRISPPSRNLAVTRLAPAKHPGPLDDEGGPVGHVPDLVEDAVGSNGGAVDIAQQRKREVSGLGKRIVAEGAVRADREEHPGPRPQLVCDLAQAGELDMSEGM